MTLFEQNGSIYFHTSNPRFKYVIFIPKINFMGNFYDAVNLFIFFYEYKAQ